MTTTNRICDACGSEITEGFMADDGAFYLCDGTCVMVYYEVNSMSAPEITEAQAEDYLFWSDWYWE